MTPLEFKKLLEKQVMVIDGAMGTMIQSYDYKADIFGGEEFQMLVDILVFSRPKAVEQLHFEYFRAGVHAVETNTLCSSPLRLAEFNLSRLDLAEFPDFEDGVNLKTISLQEFSYRLNRQAAVIARKALNEYQRDPSYDGRPLYVLGSLGPSNWVLSSTNADLNRGSFNQIEENFYQQSLGLIDGGVDCLMFETQQDILELKAGIFGARKAMGERKVDLPIIAQVTVDAFASLQIFNTDILAALTTIQDIGVHAFGINCGLGPDQMLPAVQKLSQYCKLPISVIPNAGLPESENGKTVYKLTPSAFVAQLVTYVEKYGINIVGGCCGTTPDHIRQLSEAVRDWAPKERKIDEATFVSGPQKAVKLDSRTSLIRIGERLNVRGSKKVREAVEKSTPIDQEVLEEVVSEQVRDLGLEIIDVCMDSNVVETKSALVEVIKAQTLDFPGALSLDSFDVEALQEAVRVYPGRPLINSISLEEYAPGVDKIDAVLEVTKDHAPVYIALTTGPGGPAVTADSKVELAKQIFDKAVLKHKIKPEQLMIDINAFPIGSESEEGVNFAKESILSIPGIKKLHPSLKTIIGVGNLTSGLAAKPYMRKVLTSVFLDEARKAGLDAAIVNPNHYVPVESLPSSDYQLGKKVVLERDLDAFAQLEEIALRKKGKPVKKKTNYQELDSRAAICAKIKDGFKERKPGSFFFQQYAYEYLDRIVLQVADIIKEIEPIQLINEYLMPNMEELGGEFADGTVSLPHLLKSADVMKQVMSFLESYMRNSAGSEATSILKGKGTIVMGTVYQDVHSIGKDLSKTLMENYGYQVVDLGVQVPLQRFIDAAKKYEAMAIGMSALLVQTSNHMITVSAMTRKQGLGQVPILVGGAPVNQKHAAYVAMADQASEDNIRSDVFYCASSMDGVNYLNQLSDSNQIKRLLEKNREKLIKAYRSGQKREKNQAQLLKTLPRRQVEFKTNSSGIDNFLPVQYLEYSMTEFLPYLNETLLFTLNWKYGGKRSWQKKGIDREELRQKLEYWAKRVDDKGWICPQAVYNLFPCRANQNTVTVLHPENRKEIAEFTFNDLIGEGKKDIFSVAQYFNQEQLDIIGIQLTTAGPDVDKAIQSLKGQDQESALMLQGLSNRVAEDMAEQVNVQLNWLVFGNNKGNSTRYSPGYPAMADISNNRAIADLLDAVPHLGIQLTEAFEFYPTGTTAAVVCFHPGASYH